MENQALRQTLRKQSRLKSCAYWLGEGILIGLVSTIVCVCLVFLALYMWRYQDTKSHHAEVRRQQEKWETHQPTDYRITYESDGLAYNIGTAKATICNGKLVKAENPYCDDSSTACQTEFDLDEYPIQNPIEELFRLADKCLEFCSVNYDSKYGYPSYVGGGFIEGGWVDVASFEVISCDTTAE